MRRRSKPGREPVKARRHKAVTLKHRNAPKAVRRRSSSAAGQDKKVARLTASVTRRWLGRRRPPKFCASSVNRRTTCSPYSTASSSPPCGYSAATWRLCLLCDSATFSHAAMASPEGPFGGRRANELPIDRSANFPSRAILDKKMLHLPDWSLHRPARTRTENP